MTEFWCPCTLPRGGRCLHHLSPLGCKHHGALICSRHGRLSGSACLGEGKDCLWAGNGRSFFVLGQALKLWRPTACLTPSEPQVRLHLREGSLLGRKEPIPGHLGEVGTDHRAVDEGSWERDFPIQVVSDTLHSWCRRPPGFGFRAARAGIVGVALQSWVGNARGRAPPWWLHAMLAPLVASVSLHILTGPQPSCRI